MNNNWISILELPEVGQSIEILRDVGEKEIIQCEIFESTKYWSESFNNVILWRPAPPTKGE